MANENMSIEKAAKLMEENRVRRLVVQNDEGVITGICSLGDIAVYVDKKIAGEFIKDVSEPSAPER